MKAQFRWSTFWVLFFISFFLPFAAEAVCPACTVVVAGGLGISRWIGIDDFISAIWIGGLCLSVTAWSWSFLKKKQKLNAVTGFAVLFLVYFFALIPLYKLNFINLPGNRLWGVDKIILGVTAGTIVFWLGAFIHSKLKKRNEGKVYFPFQKVAVPAGLLLVVSLGYYIYCKCAY
ncbi:MAG: hypothetical protein FJZ04_02810 [Candidatus Moranbacteria bacterium]|nr:hypothetical protein [Candidatus Moranbacteria bacterium]